MSGDWSKRAPAVMFTLVPQLPGVRSGTDRWSACATRPCPHGLFALVRPASIGASHGVESLAHGAGNRRGAGDGWNRSTMRAPSGGAGACLLVLALVGAVIGGVASASRRQAAEGPSALQGHAEVGAAPKGGGNLIGGGMTSSQINFYASSYTVAGAGRHGADQNIPGSSAGRYMTAQVGVPKATSARARPPRPPRDPNGKAARPIRHRDPHGLRPDPADAIAWPNRTPRRSQARSTPGQRPPAESAASAKAAGSAKTVDHADHDHHR